MPISILMPALSPTMKAGNLVKWHKKKGDIVETGDMLADIETDKATMEVEAVDDGVLGALLVNEGAQDVVVNTPIAVLLEEGEDESALDVFLKNIGTSDVQSSTSEDPTSGSEVATTPSSTSVEKLEESEVKDTNAPKASPLARKMAQECGVDLKSVKGTGPYGRIIKRDVEDVSQGVNPPVSRSLNTPTGATEEDFSGYEPSFSLQPISGMRRVIGERLCISKTTQPHFYLSLDVACDAVLALRQTILKKTDIKLSLNDFVLKATAAALQAFPACNSAWSKEGIRIYDSVDLAVAVSLDEGLITPVIRSANTKNLRTLSKEMKALAKNAREGSLKPQDFQGGTFTVSSLGMFGIKAFSAIINPPQSGILAVGAMQKAPAFDDAGNIISRALMTLTLSVDHRLVDGVLAALFLNKIKEFIEEPSMMVV